MCVCDIRQLYSSSHTHTPQPSQPPPPPPLVRRPPKPHTMFVDEQKRKKKLSDDFDVDDIETQKLLSQLVDDDHVEHVNGNDRDDHHHLLDDDDILTSGDEIEDGDNDGRHKHQSTIDTVHVSRTKAITSCLVYSFSSCSMTLVNKSLASRYVPK